MVGLFRSDLNLYRLHMIFQKTEGLSLFKEKDYPNSGLISSGVFL